jgi:predicted secreted Zn-dependent protease
MITRIFLSVMLAGSVSAALGAPPAKPIFVRVVLTTNYYAVTGSSPHEIWHAMVEARPWKTNHNYSATTTWVARSQYRFDAGEDGFRLVKYDEETKVTVTLPRWTPPPDASPETVRRWTKFINALALHENGHVNIACQATGELMREMGALGTFASRQELREAARDTENRVLDKYRERERAYDLETQHGVLQGARF